jgi:hypothetical protein
MSSVKDKTTNKNAEDFLLNDVSNRLAQIERKIALEARDKKQYRKKREEEEGDTQRKIELIYKQSTSIWVYVRDRILPPVIVGVILYFLLNK